MVDRKIKISFITDNDDLYRSFARAFKSFNTALFEIAKTEDIPMREQNTIILFEKHYESEFISLRNSIRLMHKLLNPIAVFCYEPFKDGIIQNDDHHTFFSVPFELSDFVARIESLKPIPSHSDLVKFYPKWLKEDRHTIQNWILASERNNDVIAIIQQLKTAVNPSNDVKDIGARLIGSLRDSAWRDNAFKIAEDVRHYLNELYLVEEADMDHILIVDDEINETGPLGKIISQLAKDLEYTARFKNPLEDAIEPNSYTKFAFLDVKLDKGKTGQSRIIAEELRRNGVPFAVLSAYDSKEVNDPTSIKMTSFKNKIDEIVKYLKVRQKELKPSSKITSEIVTKANADITSAINLLTDYMSGVITKSEAIDKIPLKLRQGDQTLMQMLNNTELPESGPYPAKFYGSLRWLKKENLNNPKEQTRIKQMIAASNRKGEEWCKLQYNDINKGIFLFDNHKIGHISFTSKDQLWQMLKKCIDSHPDACDLSSFDRLYDSIDKIHDMVQLNTDWRLLELLTRKGPGSYKLNVKSVIPLTQRPIGNKSWVDREEFDRTIKDLKKSQNDMKEKIDEILKIVVKQKENNKKRSTKP